MLDKLIADDDARIQGGKPYFRIVTSFYGLVRQRCDEFSCLNSVVGEEALGLLEVNDESGDTTGDYRLRVRVVSV